MTEQSINWKRYKKWNIKTYHRYKKNTNLMKGDHRGTHWGLLDGTGARLSVSETTFTPLGQCSMVKSNSAKDKHHLESLDCWGLIDVSHLRLAWSVITWLALIHCHATEPTWHQCHTYWYLYSLRMAYQNLDDTTLTLVIQEQFSNLETQLHDLMSKQKEYLFEAMILKT